MKLLVCLCFINSALATVNIGQSNIHAFVDSNPDVQSLRYRLVASQKLKGNLTRSFLPKVNLSFGQEKYSTGPYDHVTQPFGGIEAKINIFNSGKDNIENDKRSLEAEVSEIDSTMLKAQVLAEIRRALAQLAYFEETGDILRSALSNNLFNMEAAKKRVSAGLTSTTDSLDFKQQDIMMHQELSTVEYEIGVVKRLLLILFGHEPDQEVIVSYVNTHPEHENELIHETQIKNARGESLLVKKAFFQSEIAKLEMSSAKRWWSPTVDLYGYALRFTQKEREYARADQRNDVAIGFRISMPLFDGGEGIRVAQSKTDISSAQESMARSKELEFAKNRSDISKRLELTHKLIHGAEENVEVMNKYRQGILSEYNRGVKNSPDVLQANQRWIHSKNQFAEIKRNYHFALADALYLRGIIE